MTMTRLPAPPLRAALRHLALYSPEPEQIADFQGRIEADIGAVGLLANEVRDES